MPTTPLDIRDTRSISYWQRTAGLPSAAPNDSPVDVIETDLCVVGGGVTGSAAAYFAGKMGMDVVLLEAREPALGASGRNAGMVLSGIADNYAEAVCLYGRETARSLWQLSIDNREATLALADALGVGYNRCGSWLLADDEAEAAQLAEAHTLLSEDGFPHEYSPHDPLRRGFLAGLYRPNDAVIHPARLVRALNAAAQARVINGSPVTGLLERNDGRVEVVSARARVIARRVLLNTNAYSRLLDPYFEDKVFAYRGQIQVTEPAPMIFHEAGYSHFGYWYFRQIPEADDPSLGRWLIGGARHLHFGTENHTFDETATDPVQDDLRAYTARYFPELANVKISHRWAGIMGFTADGLPLIGALPHLPAVSFCVGFNGHGMGLGLMVTRRALDWMFEDADRGVFAAER
ncbi:MAG: FAD-binding oxidoreductase [Caldilineaceae bacterium]